MTVEKYVDNDGFGTEILKDTRNTLQSDLGTRFDCNYRNPAYFRVIKTLRESCETQAWELKNIGNIDGITIKEGSTPKGQTNFSALPGVPFIKTKNVYKGYLKTENLSFLTDEAHNKKIANAVRDGHILVTIIGANFEVIGRAYLFNHEDLVMTASEEANMNQNILRLGNLPDGYDKQFFECFLNSPLGQVQFRRFSKQSAQVNLSSGEVKLIQVPKPPQPFQERAAKIVLKGRERAAEITRDSDSQVEEVNRELLKVAGVSAVPVNVRGFQTEIVERMNAEFYHPKYVKLYSELREQEKTGNVQIKKLCAVSPRIEEACKFDDESTYEYVEVGDVDGRIGRITSSDSVKGKDLPSRAKWEIKENYLLFPILLTSRKNTALVDKKYDGSIASNGFAVFSVENKAMRYYLFAVLRSPIIQMQFRQQVTGSIQLILGPDIVDDLQVPIPTNNEVFESVTYLIEKSMNYIAQSYGLAEDVLQNAQSIFNNLILGKVTVEQAEEQSARVLSIRAGRINDSQ